jgi:hypothetical protein
MEIEVEEEGPVVETSEFPDVEEGTREGEGAAGATRAGSPRGKSL